MNHYTSVDQQLHIISQIIARVNKTYVPIKEDDSHTNLAFDSLGNRILGHWFFLSGNKLMLTYCLTNQDMEWINEKQQIIHSSSAINKTIPQLTEDVMDFIEINHKSEQKELMPMHYDMPDYQYTNKPIKNLSREALSNWAHYRLLANEACGAVANYLSTPCDIRIWTHHFDTGIFVKAHSKLSIGFGLAMQDDMAGAPYLYVSAYPEGFDINFNKVSELPYGKWVNNTHWKGAILTLDEMDSFPHAGTTFIQYALQWYLDQE